MTAMRALPETGAWNAAGRPARWVAAEFAAILALGALVALAFQPVYGSAQLFVALLGFLAVGLALALVAALRSLSVGSVVLAAIVAWFVLGTPLLMPSAGIAFVVPTGRSLFGLLTGPVTAWRDMLTLDPPIGETANLFVVPGVVGLLMGVGAGVIVLRSALPTLAWLPMAGGYLVAAALGAHEALWPTWTGLAFVLAVLLWTTHQRGVLRDRLSETHSAVRPVRLALGAGMLVVAGLAGLVLGPLATGSADRATLRAVVDIPIDLVERSSPLQAFRGNITHQRTSTLFEVSGARPGDIVRLATLDTYDGIAYRVTTLDDTPTGDTTFRRVGQWIAEDSHGDELAVHVRIRGYRGQWVPTVGRTRHIHFDGDRRVTLGEGLYFQHGSGTAVVRQPLQDGDSYELAAVVAQRPADSAIAGAEAARNTQRRVTGVPDQVRVLAREWTAGAATGGEQALALEHRLRQGYFSHGQADEVPSLPGHSTARIGELLADPQRMIGDAEQYAVAMALMARELDIPARVIYGYRVEGGSSITGDQVGAWPELQFEDLGWVRFDPTPPVDRKATDEEPPEPPKPQPYVANPPPPPQRPEVPEADDQLPIDTGEAPDEGNQIDWAQVGTLVLLTGIPLVTIVIPIALVIGLKLRRRARRRHDPEVANRVAGAWLELVDKARDLGRSPSVSATRSEQAEQLRVDFPRLGASADPISLAKEADWLVFAPGSPTEGVVDEYWRESKKVARGMRHSVSWPRWVLSGLSTKSFRRVRAGGRVPKSGRSG